VRVPVSTKLARTSLSPCRSDSLSAGFKYREPHGIYVLSGIDVTVMDNATFRARPDTDIQRERVEYMPTVEAAFGGGIPFVDLDQVPPIPLSFVFQLGHKLRPTYTTDSFCKTVVLDHVFDVQALHTDRLVFTYQAGRELMQEVTAAISNTGVYSGYLLTSFSTVLAPLRFLACRLCAFASRFSSLWKN
jgi:hypothetical protein